LAIITIKNYINENVINSECFITYGINYLKIVSINEPTMKPVLVQSWAGLSRLRHTIYITLLCSIIWRSNGYPLFATFAMTKTITSEFLDDFYTYIVFFGTNDGLVPQPLELPATTWMR